MNVDAPAKTGPGSTVTFNVNVSATGSGPVSGVVVSDYLPYTMTYLSSSPAGIVSGNAVSWNTGTLSPGETRSYQVTGTFPATANGVYTDVAEATGSATNNVSVKGNRILPIQVAGGPSINFTVTANRTTVAPGGLLTYSILINNNGTQDLVGVSAYDVPPQGSTFISSNYPPQNIAPSRYVWTPSTLPAGGSLPIGSTMTINVTIRVSPTASGSIIDTAGGGGAVPNKYITGEGSLTTVVKK